MQPEALRIARDASVVLLALEIMVLGAIPLALFYYVSKGLRAFYPKARSGLVRANEVVDEYSGIARRALLRGSQPAIRLAGATERVETTVRHIFQRR